MSNSLLASSSNFPLISSSSLVSLSDAINPSNGVIKVTFNNFTKHVRIDEGSTSQNIIERILTKMPLSFGFFASAGCIGICDEGGERIPLGLYTNNGELLKNDQEIFASMAELHIKPVGTPFKVLILTCSTSDSQVLETTEKTIYIDQNTTVGQCLSKLELSSTCESIRMVKSALIEGEKREISLFDDDILLLEQMDEINGQRISYAFIIKIESSSPATPQNDSQTNGPSSTSTTNNSACEGSKSARESVDSSGCHDCHTKDIAFISMTLGRRYCSRCSIKAIRWQSLSRAIPLRIRPLKFFKASSDITNIIKLLEQVPSSFPNSHLCVNGSNGNTTNNSNNPDDIAKGESEMDVESLYEEIEFHTDQRIRMVVDSVLFSNNNFDIDQLLYNEGTLMHLAAYHGDGPMIELLIMLGANPLINNRRNQKPSEISKGEKVRNKLREYELLYKSMMEHLPRLRSDIDSCIATITNCIIQGNIQYNIMANGSEREGKERGTSRRIASGNETISSSSTPPPCTTTGCSRERFLELLQDIYGQIEYRIYGLKNNTSSNNNNNEGREGSMEGRKRNKLNGMEDEQFGELVCLTLQELKLREDIAIFLSKQNMHDQLASP